MTVDELRLLLEDLIKNDEPDTYNELEEKAYISYISEMSAHERHKLTIDLLEDLKAYDNYFDLLPITATIYNYLEGNIKYEDFKIDIPDLKPLKFHEPQIEDIKHEFETALYQLVLREKFIGQREVFTDYKILDMFNDALNRRVDELKNSVCVPKEILDIIERIDKTNKDNKYKYNDDELLSRLFLHENGIDYKPNLHLEKLLKLDLQKQELVVDIAVNTKEMKNLKRKVTLFTTVPLYLGMMGFAILLAHGLILPTKKDKSIVTINHDKSIEQDNNLLLMTDSEVKKIIKENAKKDVTRNYITEFGVTDEEGNTNVKVYDYTGVDVSMDELDTMVLDDEKLVLNKTYRRNDVNDYFGKYTGKAHRDFSTIEFKTGYGTAVKITEFMLAVIYNIPTLAMIEDAKQKNEKYRKYLSMKKLNKKNISELEKILLEIKTLQEKELIADEIDTIKNDNVDKKLEENKPSGFRI